MFDTRRIDYDGECLFVIDPDDTNGVTNESIQAVIDCFFVYPERIQIGKVHVHA